MIRYYFIYVQGTKQKNTCNRVRLLHYSVSSIPRKHFTQLQLLYDRFYLYNLLHRMLRKTC